MPITRPEVDYSTPGYYVLVQLKTRCDNVNEGNLIIITQQSSACLTGWFVAWLLRLPGWLTDRRPNHPLINFPAPPSDSLDVQWSIWALSNWHPYNKGAMFDRTDNYRDNISYPLSRKWQSIGLRSSMFLQCCLRFISRSEHIKYN